MIEGNGMICYVAMSKNGAQEMSSLTSARIEIIQIVVSSELVEFLMFGIVLANGPRISSTCFLSPDL